MFSTSSNCCEKIGLFKYFLHYKNMDFCLKCDEANFFGQDKIWLKILRQRISQRRNVSNCRAVAMGELPDLLLWLHTFLHILAALCTWLIAEIMESICKRESPFSHQISIEKLFLVSLKILLVVFLSVYAFPDIITGLIRKHKRYDTVPEYFNVIAI